MLGSNGFARFDWQIYKFNRIKILSHYTRNMQEPEQMSEWTPRDDGKMKTREIAGWYSNVYHPDVRSLDEPRYHVELGWSVVNGIQSILIPKEGWEWVKINGKEYITASFVGDWYPKHGVWLILDPSTRATVPLEFEGKNYLLASFGQFITGTESNERVYNSQIWPLWSKGQFAIPANIKVLADNTLEIRDIYSIELKP